jgi:hypothetical protein
MITSILIIIGILIEVKWNPRLDWVEDSGVVLLYYNSNNSRKYKVIFKF